MFVSCVDVVLSCDSYRCVAVLPGYDLHTVVKLMMRVSEGEGRFFVFFLYSKEMHEYFLFPLQTGIRSHLAHFFFSKLGTDLGIE